MVYIYAQGDLKTPPTWHVQGPDGTVWVSVSGANACRIAHQHKEQIENGEEETD